jgi:D-xylose transport system substrate-binding protein
MLVLAACSGSAEKPTRSPVAATASGTVGVILAGGSSASPRYHDFGAQLQRTFEQAGYDPSGFRIDDAQGSDANQLSLAQADVAAGATVLVVDPLTDDVGTQIADYARQHSVKVITFERPIYTGAGNYHITFDSVHAGKLIGQGFMECVTDWKVKKPKVFVLNGGEDTDPNAVALAMGYNQVLWGDTTTPQTPGKTNNLGYTLIGDQIAKGWDVASGTTAFQVHYNAHKEINATLEASDDLGNGVIKVLRRAGVKPNTVPTTGQDATLQGMVNILQGYQCGSVYRSLLREAQAVVSLATALRTGVAPSSKLVNGTINPPAGEVGRQQPAVLLAPVWVSKANMDATVLKDGFVDRAALCGVVGVATCQANNIPAY